MGGYWEGQGNFEPIQEQIEWFVTAGEEGPGEPQYAIFKSACERYGELRSKALSAIRESAKSAAEQQDIHSLKLVAMDVPADLSQSSPWELSFVGSAWHYAVQFIGWEPSGFIDISR
jgi:hypothetical protein